MTLWPRKYFRGHFPIAPSNLEYQGDTNNGAHRRKKKKAVVFCYAAAVKNILEDLFPSQDFFPGIEK